MVVIVYLPVQSVAITTKVVSSNTAQARCQWLAAGMWFSPDTPVFSKNKTDRHDITEILLKVALNTINQTKPNIMLTKNHIPPKYWFLNQLTRSEKLVFHILYFFIYYLSDPAVTLIESLNHTDWKQVQ